REVLPEPEEAVGIFGLGGANLVRLRLIRNGETGRPRGLVDGEREGDAGPQKKPLAARRGPGVEPSARAGSNIEPDQVWFGIIATHVILAMEFRRAADRACRRAAGTLQGENSSSKSTDNYSGSVAGGTSGHGPPDRENEALTADDESRR